MITRRLVATLQAGLLAFGVTAMTLGTGVVADASITPACATTSIVGNSVTVTCAYTGGMQTWTPPAGITSATFAVFGAQGGSFSSTSGGAGGQTSATVTVVPGAVVTVVVGGQGSNAGGSGAGGYNGGGHAGTGGTFSPGSSGGGASDIRTGAITLTDRILVAGGGGGAGNPGTGGGAGGDLSGANGVNNTIAGSGGGGGATQVAVGAGGAGGSICCGGPGGAGSSATGGNGGSATSGIGGGGGGGGYFGGGGGGTNASGGGGSGFGPVGTTFATGVRGGSGVVTITYALRSTSVAVVCAPSTMTVGLATTCTATVTDTAGGTTVTPGSVISFASSSSGSFSNTTCPNGTSATTPSTMSCAVAYTPTAVGTGTHTISVTSSRDFSHAASSSSGAGDAAITVGQGVTTTALGASSTPAVVGQPVTYTALIGVASPGTGSPTGSFAFTDNGSTIPGCGSVTISGGRANCLAAYPSTGSHPIVATYSGDTNFAPSGNSLAQSIVAASTTTVLGSSPHPSVVGQLVTYTASIGVASPGSGTPTGAFAFTDNGSTITGCDAVTIGAGSATCTARYPAAGSHPIVAMYSGDGNFATSSGSLTQSVVAAATTTALGSSMASSVVGEPITLTATVNVTVPGAGTPTGRVAFTDGSTTVVGCGGQTLDSSAVATCIAAPGTASSHSFTATYGGDTNYSTSTSPPVSDSVTRATTATVLGSSSNSAVVGQPVTYTASIGVVSPGSGTPTGNFAFTDNGTTIPGCGAVTIGGGSASCSATYLSTGNDPIVATYSGDTNFATSAASLTQSIVAAATTTGLGSSADPAVVGQPVTYTASIGVASPGSGTPTGAFAFAFTDNGMTITGCNAMAIGGGSATCAVTYLATGSHTIVATYAGDGNFATSSHSLTQSIVAAATTTALGSSTASSVVGEPITLTATIAVTAPGAGTPTGTVAFTNGATTATGCGAQALNSSAVATCTFTPPGVGSYSFTATYGGSGSYGTSTSSPVLDAVSKASTSVTVTSSRASSTAGDPVTIRVTVKALAPGGGNPTGTITVIVDGNALGTAALDSTVDSLAVLTTSALATGPHHVTASYGGDANYTGAVSAVATTVSVVPVVMTPATGTGLGAVGAFALPEFGIMLLLSGTMALAWAARRRAGVRR